MVAWRIAGLVAAILVCRLAALGSDQVALCLAVAVALGVPGLALANVTGLTRRVNTPELLALIPIAGLAAWAPPMAVGMAIHLPYRWVLVVVMLASTLCVSWDVRAIRRVPWEPIGVLVGASAFAIVATRYEPTLGGDALYHAGVIRKLLDLQQLSLSGISPYWHGHPHAGYAFPLLHSMQAAAISFTGGDPSLAYQNLTPAFAFLIPVAAYGAGRSLASIPVAIAAATFASWDAMSRHAVLGLVKQPPYFTFLVLFPAIIILLNHVYRDRDDRSWWVWVVIGAAGVALIHPTYSVMLLPMVLAVVLLWPRAWPILVGSIAVTAVIDLWIWVIAIHGGERLHPWPGHVREFIEVHHHPIALSGLWILAHRPEALLGLVAAVVILFMPRSPWHLPAALVAATVTTIATPGLGLILTHVIAGGQVARFATVAPWMFVSAIVLGAIAKRLRNPLMLGAAVIGIAVASELLNRYKILWGQGTTRVHHVEIVPPIVGVFTAPDLVVVALAVTGGIALLVRAFDRDRSLRPISAAPPMIPVLLLLAALLTGAFTFRGNTTWDVIQAGSYSRPAGFALTPGVVDYFHAHPSNPFPVVMAPYREPPTDGVSYALVGRATVYTVGLLENHTRATPRDHPAIRRGQVTIFYSPLISEARRRQMMRRLHVDYVLFSKWTQPASVLHQLEHDPTLKQVYVDPLTVPRGYGRFVLFHRTSG